MGGLTASSTFNFNIKPELYVSDSVSVISGGPGDDILYGLDSNSYEFIEGGEGNDQLYGKEGEDLLLGGAGNDLLVGGKGSDTYHRWKSGKRSGSEVMIFSPR